LYGLRLLLLLYLLLALDLRGRQEELLDIVGVAGGGVPLEHHAITREDLHLLLLLEGL
jgi:hypothetical protein